MNMRGVVYWPTRLLVWGVLLGAFMYQKCSHAVEVGSTQIAPVKSSAAAAASPNVSALLGGGLWWMNANNDALQARMWGLSVEEIQRARVLMQGPRGAFSSLQLSPLEALGMHASTEAERRRYAEMFAKVSVEDTKRMIAWMQVGAEVTERLTAGSKVLDFSKAPKAAVSYETADMLGVPRSSVVPPVKATTPARQGPFNTRALGRAVDNRDGQHTQASGGAQ
jgi:hypothetical protein